MIVEITETIRTRKMTLQPGQRVDLPDDVVRKLAGKVRPVLPGGITAEDLAAEFGQDPDWPKVNNDHRWLHHLAETLHLRRLRERGEVPPTYTASRECLECGPVLLEEWTPHQVKGCPWCLTRGRGMPVPRFEEHRTAGQDRIMRTDGAIGGNE